MGDCCQGPDPFQIYKVEPESCLKLEVKVLCGRKITKGWTDYVDTPDPYVRLVVRKAPEGKKQTTVKDNNTNPVWNESFTFYLKDAADGIMEIHLMESNYTPDSTVGHLTFNLNELKLDILQKKTFIFNEVSEVDIELKLSNDTNPTLRYCSSLCHQEREFLTKRKPKVLQGLQQLLGERGPKSVEEVPTVAVIGSGGGFRAMVGLNGVFNALQESGILQCTTFVAGLSGSSWYISTLYSNEGWPSKTSAELENQLKTSITTNESIWSYFSNAALLRHVGSIVKKYATGQPVSFTDFYGRMIGEILLTNRYETKFSEQRTKIGDGSVPLPLLACVHAKKNRSAKSFHEWVEFSPYEIGIEKYEIFMPTELFGSKFFRGRLCKTYEEVPLCFLQGDIIMTFPDKTKLEGMCFCLDGGKQYADPPIFDSLLGVWGSAYSVIFNQYLPHNTEETATEESMREEIAEQVKQNLTEESYDSSEDEGEMEDENSQTDIQERKIKQSGFWSYLLNMSSSLKDRILNTRGSRAGVIHNFLRGLSFSQVLSPLMGTEVKPDTVAPSESTGVTDMFDGMYEKSETENKYQYVMDAGLAFNSPYPLAMRSQREVDIILSFDFSGRDNDDIPPFSELHIAADWATKHKIPFPPIDTAEIKAPFKEVYVFKHPTDPHCPVVLHFPLVNNEFRNFVKPGVKRTTQEERDFADFKIFDNNKTPYSTFNFCYSNKDFDRLSELTKFNTLSSVETIKNAIADVVALKRKSC